MTELRLENLIIPGAPLGRENPLPFFRNPAVNTQVRVTEDLPAEKRAYLGWETGFRVLPYRMQDQYTRQREPLTFRSIVLENENLKATFLPEIGGRLISLFHKPTPTRAAAPQPGLPACQPGDPQCLVLRRYRMEHRPARAHLHHLLAPVRQRHPGRAGRTRAAPVRVRAL